MIRRMAHAVDEPEQALLRRAHESLHAGVLPEAVFAELAADARDVRSVAIAVCVAAGTSRADAEQRWAAEGEPLFVELLDGDEEGLGVFLEMAGFFDFHRPLDEREQQIRSLLGQAFDARGGWKSGAGHHLIRKLQTGRLTDALASMAAHAPDPGAPSPSAYWAHLLAAATLLAGSDDSRVEPIVLLCRRHLDQLLAADTD